jgi:hypothetical protein
VPPRQSRHRERLQRDCFGCPSSDRRFLQQNLPRTRRSFAFAATFFLLACHVYPRGGALAQRPRRKRQTNTLSIYLASRLLSVGSVARGGQIGAENACRPVGRTGNPSRERNDARRSAPVAWAPTGPPLCACANLESGQRLKRNVGVGSITSFRAGDVDFRFTLDTRLFWRRSERSKRVISGSPISNLWSCLCVSCQSWARPAALGPHNLFNMETDLIPSKRHIPVCLRPT